MYQYSVYNTIVHSSIDYNNYRYNNNYSVNGSKRTLLYQADEGAKLEAENKDLYFRVAQLKESHA